MTYESLPADLVTGIDVIDADHDRLFGLVELFREAKTDQNLGLLKTVVVGLVEYTVYHFRKEEIGFRACGYAEADRHVAEHRKLEATAAQVEKDLDSNPDSFTPEKMQEIDDFLVDWLDNHIRKSDMAFRATFEASPDAIAAMEDFSFSGHLAEGAEEVDPMGDILGDLEG